MKQQIAQGLIAATMALATLPARADTQGPTFQLLAGGGLPVCEALLSAALAAPAATARPCDLSDPGAPSDGPGTFIDWPMLRAQLGPDVITPQWRALDLTQPDQLERALFGLGVTYASLPDATRSSGMQSWRDAMTDAEIMDLVRRYRAEGGLPDKLLMFQDDLQIDPGRTFYAAEISQGLSAWDILMMNHVPANLPPLCFAQSTQAVRQIVVTFRQGLDTDQAQPLTMDDLLLFDGQLYGVRYMDRQRSFYPDTVKLWPLVTQDGQLDWDSPTPACDLATESPG